VYISLDGHVDVWLAVEKKENLNVIANPDRVPVDTWKKLLESP
jgi:hypothetical protein